MSHWAKKKSGRLFVSVLAGRKLAVKDLFTSDPYVVTSVDETQAQKTPIVFKTLNPEWSGQDYSFDVSETNAELIFHIWDYDEISKDDDMGIVIVPLSDLQDGKEIDEWLAVKKNRKSSSTQGQLHVRVMLTVASDLEHKTPLFASIASNSWDKVQTILPSASLSDASLKDSDGNTPLHLFCLQASPPLSEVDVVNILDAFSRLGVDFADENSDRQTPVHFALRNKNLPIRKCLVKWMSSNTRPRVPHGPAFIPPASHQSMTQFCKQYSITDEIFPLLFAGGYLPSEQDKAMINSPSEGFGGAADYLRVLSILQNLELPLSYFSKLAAEEIDFESLLTLGPDDLARLSIPEADKNKLLAAIKAERGDDEQEDLPGVPSASASRLARMNVDVQKARQRRDSITSLEQFFRRQVSAAGHPWLLEASDISTHEQIGEGGFAKVYKGDMKLHSGKTVAIAVKAAKHAILATPDQVEALKKEFEVLAAVSAPHIVQFYGVSFVGATLNLISEFCAKGTLQSVLKKSDHLDLSLALKYMIGAAKGLLTLHTWDPPIFHRDMKSLNLLVTDQDVCKLTDFGTSVFQQQQNAAASDNNVVGTLPYCSPETLSSGKFTEKSDVYSLGIVFWEVISRVFVGRYQQPYQGMKFNSDAEFIIQVCESNMRPPVPDGVPEPLKQLLARCWHSSPSERPSTAEIVDTLLKFQASL